MRPKFSLLASLPHAIVAAPHEEGWNVMTFRGSPGPIVYAGTDGRRSTAAVHEASPPGASKPRLLDRVRGAIRARHYSRRTEKASVAWTRRYYTAKALVEARDADQEHPARRRHDGA
jgi:hypothetical protein